MDCKTKREAFREILRQIIEVSGYMVAKGVVAPFPNVSSVPDDLLDQKTVEASALLSSALVRAADPGHQAFHVAVATKADRRALQANGCIARHWKASPRRSLSMRRRGM